MQHTQQSQIFNIPSNEVQIKLTQILVSLQQQNRQIKKYFNEKIWDLQNEIQAKDKDISKMKNNIQQMLNKLSNKEKQVFEKQSSIEELTIKIKTLQNRTKQKLLHFVSNLDLFDEINVEEGIQIKANHSETSKRINISNYFIKSIQNTKNSAKQQQFQSQRNSLFLNQQNLRLSTNFINQLHSKPGAKVSKVISVADSDWTFSDEIMHLCSLQTQNKQKQNLRISFASQSGFNNSQQIKQRIRHRIKSREISKSNGFDKGSEQKTMDSESKWKQGFEEGEKESWAELKCNPYLSQ